MYGCRININRDLLNFLVKKLYLNCEYHCSYFEEAQNFNRGTREAGG